MDPGYTISCYPITPTNITEHISFNIIQHQVVLFLPHIRCCFVPITYQMLNCSDHISDAVFFPTTYQMLLCSEKKQMLFCSDLILNVVLFLPHVTSCFVPTSYMFPCSHFMYAALFPPYFLPSPTLSVALFPPRLLSCSHLICCLVPISFVALFPPRLLPCSHLICCLVPTSFVTLFPPHLLPCSHLICYLVPTSFVALFPPHLLPSSHLICCLVPTSFVALFPPKLFSTILSLWPVICC